MATRICPVCGEERDCETDFNKGNRKSDGKSSRCKDCNAKACTERYRRTGPPPSKLFTCKRCGVDYRNINGAGSRTLCQDCNVEGKFCSRCKEFKPHDRFSGSDLPLRGRSRHCRDGCVQAYKREYLYGPGAGALLAQFDDRCGICGTTESAGRWKAMHVDHCHTTGAIRGLLCDFCNKGIGFFKDNPQLLLAAVAYLDQFAAGQNAA